MEEKRAKIKVGVLGATGAVGQKFVVLLSGHPWFQLTELGASERSAGKPYREAVNWVQKVDLPREFQNLEIKECDPSQMDCEIVFSALDASIAGEVETAFAKSGIAVFSNSKNHRLSQLVPLTIPEVNPEHFGLLELQQKEGGSKGFIVTNSNCSTMFLAMALAPIHQKYGVEKVQVTTMQAVSGAGYPGVPSLDILGNVIPYIGGEEEKIEIEARKILGEFKGDRIELAPFVVSAQCNRVAVEEGHLECVSVSLKAKPSLQEFIETYRNHSSSLTTELSLPSAPLKPIVVMEETNRPQPKKDVEREKGMLTLIGRIRECPVLDFKFVILGHNTIRGAAGASLLNAEYLVAKGLLGGRDS